MERSGSFPLLIKESADAASNSLSSLSSRPSPSRVFSSHRRFQVHTRTACGSRIDRDSRVSCLTEQVGWGSPMAGDSARRIPFSAMPHPSGARACRGAALKLMPSFRAARANPRRARKRRAGRPRTAWWSSASGREGTRSHRLCALPPPRRRDVLRFLFARGLSGMRAPVDHVRPSGRPLVSTAIALAAARRRPGRPARADLAPVGLGARQSAGSAVGAMAGRAGVVGRSAAGGRAGPHAPTPGQPPIR